MTILSGRAGGVFFRGEKTSGYGYILLIQQDGTYELDYTGENTQMTLAHGLTQMLRTGLNQSNIVAVVAFGRDIDVYINHQHTLHISDRRGSGDQIGLIADSAGTMGPTTVAYNDVRVWNLS